jgi:hypothetical protein
MMKRALAAFLFFGFAGSGAAVAGDRCQVSMDQWQPREAVQKMAEARGWTVNRIRIDDGCYQIRGVDRQGRAFKARIDPSTLAVVKIKNKGQAESGGDRRDPRRMETGDIGALPSNELLRTNMTPKIEVK